MNVTMYWKEYDAWGIWRIVLKTSIVVIILVSVVFLTSGFIWDESEEMSVVPDDPLDIIDEEPPVPPGNNRLVDKGRHVLTVEDESVHLLCRREWWYFNVFFDDPDSDLANWSMIISFNKMAPNDIRYLL